MRWQWGTGGVKDSPHICHFSRGGSSRSAPADSLPACLTPCLPVAVVWSVARLYHLPLFWFPTCPSDSLNVLQGTSGSLWNSLNSTLFMVFIRYCYWPFLYSYSSYFQPVSRSDSDLVIKIKIYIYTFFSFIECWGWIEPEERSWLYFTIFILKLLILQSQIHDLIAMHPENSCI